jgi:hypothetical protein
VLCLCDIHHRYVALSAIGRGRGEGARDNVVAEALCYKPEDRGFETRWQLNFINLLHPSGPLKSWGLLSLWHKWISEHVSGEESAAGA